MKRTLALTAAAALTMGLAACSTADENTSQGEALQCKLPQAKLQSPVKVAGEKGEQVEVTADLSAENLTEYQLLEAEAGTGSKVVAAANTAYSMFVTVTDGQGKVLAASDLETGFTPDQGLAQWIVDAAGCATDNGRVVAVGPVNKVLPAAAVEAGGELTPDAPLITIIDMLGKVEKLAPEDILKYADGKEQPVDPKLPSVAFDPEKGPQITIPANTPAPKQLQIKDLLVGDGPEVADGANVYVHYRGVIWSTGEEFDSSWTRGSHTHFRTDEVVPGFSEALIGKKVGSRVLAVVDPASGYGPDWLVQRGYQADDAMVFVIDILGVENPAGK